MNLKYRDLIDYHIVKRNDPIELKKHSDGFIESGSMFDFRQIQRFLTFSTQLY